MAQANSHNSTRRAFLSTSAAAAAAVVAAPAAIASTQTDDPIFAAIGNHRAATAGARAICNVIASLETELPRERMKSDISVWGEKIVATDDPRWIDCSRASLLAWSAQDDAAIALLTVRPTTMAGVAALLRYAAEANVDDQVWPPELVDDDGNERSWHHFLVENVAAAIPQCA